MTLYETAKVFWDYLEYWPEEDEPGYDGIHSGGIKGLKPDAPPEAREAYNAWIKAQRNGTKL